MVDVIRFFTRSFLHVLRILLIWIPPIRRRITYTLNAESQTLPQVNTDSPPLGLTTEEFKSVLKTWSLVNSNLIENGIDLLMGLFSTYPDYMNLFKQFKGKELHEIRKSPMLRAHGTAFMHGMCALVENLQDTDTLIRLLHDNVERHHPRGVTYSQYKNVLGLVPGFLTDKLGSELDANGVSGWHKIIDVMCQVIQEKYKDIENQVDV